MRNKLHSHRQQAMLPVRPIQFIDLLMERSQRSFCHRPLSQQHNAFHHVVRVNDGSIFFVDRLAQLPQPHFRRLHHLPQIPHPHRSSALHLHHGRRNVVGGLHHSHSAHVQRLLPALDKSAAGIDVVGRQCRLHLCQRQPVGNQLPRIHLYLILARRPAKRIHVHNVRHRLQLIHHKPVIQRFQFHHVVSGIRAGQRVEHDLPSRTVIRPNSRIHARRQCHQLQPVQHFLPRVEGSDVIVVNNRDHRQPRQ